MLRLHVRSTLIKLGWGITNSNYMSPPAEVLNLSMWVEVWVAGWWGSRSGWPTITSKFVKWNLCESSGRNWSGNPQAAEEESNNLLYLHLWRVVLVAAAPTPPCPCYPRQLWAKLLHVRMPSAKWKKFPFLTSTDNFPVSLRFPLSRLWCSSRRTN